jgi:hypothetical protein
MLGDILHSSFFILHSSSSSASASASAASKCQRKKEPALGRPNLYTIFPMLHGAVTVCTIMT